ncbi:MAG TPA: alpha/beta hydrolase [Caulobacteraceae bacterium]
MPLDRRAERLLAMLAATGGGAAALTAASRRASLIALAEMADDATAPAETTILTAPGPGGDIPLRLYRPADATGAALLFFHGGGWVAGGFATHDGLCRRLAASGATVIAVDYRLAPEHPFPAAFDDGLAALRWIAANAAALGIDAGRLAVGGDSVGGGLAAAAALAVRDGGGPALAAQLLICPILDPAGAGGSREAFGDGHFIDRAAFAQDLKDYAPPLGDPRVAPLRAASFAGLPPAIVHTAEFDPFRDEGEAFADALAAAGVSVRRTRHDGQIHYFYAMARAIPAAHEASAQIGAELRALLD